MSKKKPDIYIRANKYDGDVPYSSLDKAIKDSETGDEIYAAYSLGVIKTDKKLINKKTKNKKG